MEQPNSIHETMPTDLAHSRQLLAAAAKDHQRTLANFQNRERDYSSADGSHETNPLYVDVRKSGRQQTYHSLSHFDQAADRHRQLSCRILCDMMQQKLPRELRDMVYNSLLQEAPWKLEEATDKNRFCSCFGLDNYDHQNRYITSARTLRCICRGYMPTHLRSIDALGPDTLPEFAEMWYRTAHPGVGSVKNFFAFIENDLFGVGLSPMSFFRRIGLDIGCECALVNKEKFTKDWTKLLQLLASKSVLSATASARMERVSIYWYWGDRVRRNYLGDLVECIERFQTLSPAVKLLDSTDAHVSVTTDGYSLTKVDRIATAIFNNQRIEVDRWTKRVDQFLEKYPDSQKYPRKDKLVNR